MRAEDNAYAPQTADDDTAQYRTEAVQRIVKELNNITNIDTNRSYNSQHNRNHDNQGQTRYQDELQNLRNDLL